MGSVGLLKIPPSATSALASATSPSDPTRLSPLAVKPFCHCVFVAERIVLLVLIIFNKLWIDLPIHAYKSMPGSSTHLSVPKTSPPVLLVLVSQADNTSSITQARQKVA